MSDGGQLRSTSSLAAGQSSYWILYFILVIAFTYFYTDVVFRQQNLAGDAAEQGGFIPGIRPGQNTEKYLNRVLSRITLVGALSWASWRSCRGWCT